MRCAALRCAELRLLRDVLLVVAVVNRDKMSTPSPGRFVDQAMGAELEEKARRNQQRKKVENHV